MFKRKKLLQMWSIFHFPSSFFGCTYPFGWKEENLYLILGVPLTSWADFQISQIDKTYFLFTVLNLWTGSGKNSPQFLKWNHQPTIHQKHPSFGNAEAEAAVACEVLLAELVLLDLQAFLQDLLTGKVRRAPTGGTFCRKKWGVPFSWRREVIAHRHIYSILKQMTVILKEPSILNNNRNEHQKIINW